VCCRMEGEVRVLRDASRSPGGFSLSVGKTTVDENIMCVACRCVDVLCGMCLCWVVVELLTSKFNIAISLFPQ
jgi:hypothetical protein